jgi:hypothetical protein
MWFFSFFDNFAFLRNMHEKSSGRQFFFNFNDFLDVTNIASFTVFLMV